MPKTKSTPQPTRTSEPGPKVANSKRSSQRTHDNPVFEPHAAGIDIGAREIYVAIPADRDEHPVRKCETFTADLHQIAAWLLRCGITTAAMESTGVYWIPVYEVLEQHGIKPCLVNPRNMKNVPGKRTDFHECQWIQYLHSMGLLHSAFRPDGEVCAVRSLMRHHNDLVGMASQHVQYMQKVLTQMNVPFQHVISDITGLTGLAILDAVVAGERDPAVLAKLRDPRIKASEETIRKSLEGNWRSEHILALKQRLSLYRSYREQINDCDEEIEKLVAACEPKMDPEDKPLPEFTPMSSLIAGKRCPYRSSPSRTARGSWRHSFSSGFSERPTARANGNIHWSGNEAQPRGARVDTVRPALTGCW